MDAVIAALASRGTASTHELAADLGFDMRIVATACGALHRRRQAGIDRLEVEHLRGVRSVSWSWQIPF
jgi:hypothetical protein